MTTPAGRDDDWMDRWSSRSDTEIAAAWISYQSRDHALPSEDDEDWWAVDALMSLSADDPLRALETAFLIARGSNNPKVLEMLGASPIEDLVSEDPTLLDAIAVEVRSNPNLRVALKSVWQGNIADLASQP